MAKKHNKISRIRILSIAIPLMISLLLVITGCEKDEDVPGFSANFDYEMIDENHVSFQNQSTGEYYWLVWDFGNGTADTTDNKNKTYEVYYPVAGDYDITLTLTNYHGDHKSVTKSVSITNEDLAVDFTTEIDTANPNYVMLTNTSVGVFESFEWRYLDLVVVDEMEHTAYFPLAGEYNIELVVTQNNTDYSLIKPVIITQDDPDYDPTLVWAEEFNYTGLPDDTYWNIETGGTGWGNNELQYYTDSESNLYVDNGMLTITAKEEQVGGRDYTSARITTQGKFDVKYGRIEARIKLPYGQGLWPAFWMLGANISTVGWPACGEIDIMEMVGGTNGDNTCYATIHWDDNGNHAQYGESYTLPSGIFADDFHVFAVEWDAQEIRGYMDDVQYYTVDITSLSEFHNNFFIILNVAVGGNWPGPPDETTEFDQVMEVDYVRVYDLEQR
ncbi:MAG: family 16 glycosylhydrolase [Bacteroidota bacterium]